MSVRNLSTTSSGIVVGSGNTLNILSGGVSIDTVASGGGGYGSIINVKAGGIDSAATLFVSGIEKVQLGGQAFSTVVSSGGSQIVMSGGNASGTVVSAGGQEIVSSGGSTAHTTVLSGGYMDMYWRGSNTVIMSGGDVDVGQRGIATGDVISNGGVETVEAGYTLGLYGQTISSVVMSGGLEVVQGITSNTTISGGTVEIMGGGKASGTLTFADSGLLELHGNGLVGANIVGFDDPAKQIDLMSIALDSTTSLSYIDSGGSGTLTVATGIPQLHHSVVLNLIGQYTVANFKTADDGHGGTMLTDPPVSGSPSLAHPH